uniref:MFS domain-containing protein n=1 Tax=Anisakis simplex TaxID=6269 RepID=A0A0M3KGN3_ANISI
LDHSADLAFLGVIVAVFSVGQTIASPVFGFWSQKTRSVKYPSIVGVILTAFGNVLYAMLPTIKTNAKWYMLVSRVIVGVGAGNLGVLRAYTSTASSAKDRNKAMALGIASFVIGQSIGPGMQALFTPIGEEGIWIGTVQLNVYTVPAYVMILLSIVSSFLLMFCFTESYAGIMETDEDSDSYLVIPKFDKIAASVLIYMWYVQQSIVTTIEV